MTPIYRPGFWCDVFALPDGRLGQVTSANRQPVRVFVEDAAAWEQTAGRGLASLRAACVDGSVVAIGTEYDSAPNMRDGGTAFLVRQGLAEPMGMTFGVQAVAIDASYAYIVRSGQSYDRIRLIDGYVEAFAHGVPGSSQGISDIAPDGTIWWADTYRTMTVAGVTLTYPNRRGPVIVGQSDPSQIAGVFDTAPFTAFLGDGFEPHVAQAGDQFALCARTPHGAAYLEGPPFPPYVAAPSPRPVPVPTPSPSPSPTPEPIPMDYLSLIERVRVKYPTPLGARHWEFLVEVAQQTGTQLFRKEDDNSILIPALGVRVSLDVIGRGTLGNRWADILADSENTARPVWQLKETPALGEYVDVSRVALPGASPVPVPPIPQPTPTPQPVPQPAPRPSGPSLSQWMDVELPQVVAAYTQRQGHAPDVGWGAFITYRRYLEPEAWPFDKMLAHERGEG